MNFFRVGGMENERIGFHLSLPSPPLPPETNPRKRKAEATHLVSAPMKLLLHR
jgi:hypothetical protein